MECMEPAVESRRGWNGRLGLREPLLQGNVSVYYGEGMDRQSASHPWKGKSLNRPASGIGERLSTDLRAPWLENMMAHKVSQKS